MKKRIGPIIAVLSVLSAAFVLPAGAVSYGDTVERSTYWYDESANVIPISDVYTFQSMNTLYDLEGNLCIDPVDMQVVGDRIFVLDKGDSSSGGAIFCLNSSFETIFVLREFVTEDGAEPLTLSNPEGFYVFDDETIYIADTGNERVIQCDMQGKVVTTFGRPELVGTDQPFRPKKLVVDSAQRMYIVCDGIVSGIVNTDGNGDFISYIGAPKVQLNPLEAFWRQFSTDEQLERMNDYTPTEYSSLAIDENDFVYGTISNLSSESIESVILSKDVSGLVSPIRKLSTAGDDILRRRGTYPPLGDLEPDSSSGTDQYSRIVDVALSKSGVYSLLDSNRGRIFTYDNDGNLLFAFGEMGNRKGTFNKAVAIDYMGNNILVLDSRFAAISIYQATDFGDRLLNAVYNQYEGSYDRAYEDWTEIIRYNSNYKFAYLGLGQAQLKAQQYEEAMQSFEYADNPYYYSMAYKEQRKINMGYTIQYIILGIIILVLAVFVSKKVCSLVNYIRGVRYEK